MSLSLIYARSLNYCIGKDGRIPWHLPDEFGHFKRTTLGKPIIMGRKTYEDHQSALPGRLNIVVSRQSNYSVAEGIELVSSLAEAIALGLSYNGSSSEEIFVIGGVSFFVEALPQASTVYETIVQTNIDGDSILSAFDFSDWTTSLLEEHAADERHAYAYKVYRHHR